MSFYDFTQLNLHRLGVQGRVRLDPLHLGQLQEDEVLHEQGQGRGLGPVRRRGRRHQGVPLHRHGHEELQQ